MVAGPAAGAAATPLTIAAARGLYTRIAQALIDDAAWASDRSGDETESLRERRLRERFPRGRDPS
jgi:hypothetical protein